MSAQHSRKAPHLTCAECEQRLQAYLDGDLAKTESLQVFLHLRECAHCAAELERFEQLDSLLRTLPQREPPADFDARILAAVPYESYRAMADLRQPRVPVILETDALPAWFRSRVVRFAGGAAAAAALAGRLSGLLSDPALIVAIIGLIPETAIFLQRIGRRLFLAFGHGRTGA